MSISTFAIASAFLLSTFAMNAQASQTWTVTTQGKINSGYDTTGVFGTVGQNLQGLSFTQSITASVDPKQWEFYSIGGYKQEVHGHGPGFIDTVTVNGHSVTFSATSTTSQGQQYLSDDISQGKKGRDPDQIFSNQIGMTAAGDSLHSYQFASSNYTAFVPTWDFGQTISQDTTDKTFNDGAVFQISGHQTARFAGVVDHISINAVPEPDTYAMLLAGMGLISVIARRRVKT
ncbi:MAG: FxDxF family PEP-CTERM protein [Pseudomonadota bacterium]